MIRRRCVRLVAFTAAATALLLLGGAWLGAQDDLGFVAVPDVVWSIGVYRLTYNGSSFEARPLDGADNPVAVAVID